MITKNKNKNDLTIDLKKIIAEDYLYSKKSNMEKFKESLLKYVAFIGIILYILISLGSWGGFITIKEVNAAEGQKLSNDLQNRYYARLERLKKCNKNVKYIKEYYLHKQDIGTRCAVIMTLSQDKIPVKYVMKDINYPSKAKEFWKIYYNIKQIRIKNGISVKTYINNKKTSKIKGFDINKLALAVAKHETNNCTKGNSASRNNCFGIMSWKNGKRFFKYYKTKEDSYKDFKRIREKYYKGLPNLAKAKKYSGNDRARIWLRNVLYFYYH